MPHEPLLPRVTRNLITGVGAFLTTVSALLFLVLFFVDLFDLHTNPYLGIVAFLVLPAVFVLGLLLIPIGVVREKRRRAAGLGPSRYEWLRLDLNEPRQRRLAGIVAALTVVNLAIVGLAAFKGLEYMDSTEFCGQVCHTVMEPEYTAYQDGPHARVRCVECHIGPGASWFVKSKVDGIRQVWAVTFNTYSRPIPTPVHDLRPARDTCEHCHWPDKFSGDVVRVYPAFADDETNTDQSTTLLLRIGGGGWRFGGPHGIHWHTSQDHRVEYIAADQAREVIPYVRLVNPDGSVREFVTPGTDVEMLKRTGELRVMDCVDCHNRPSHRFAASPAHAADRGLHYGLLPRDLPYVRREVVRALDQEYPSRETALEAIRAHLETFYAREYPELVRAADPRVAQAIAGAQRLYSHNVFPSMRVTWGTHPDHLGHMTSPGCFRCHDGEHAAADGAVIGQDCETCHRMAP